MPEKPTYKELEQAESERNQAEEALNDREERFRELADSLPQIVYETDEKGIITYANRNAFAYFGYTESELENNLNALQMISPEDRDRALEYIHKILNGEVLGGMEYSALRKDGSTFPVEIHSKIISRANKPIGLRGIILDLSKRKQMEEALKESEEKFRNIAEISLAGIYIIQDGIFMYVNKKFAEIFGYSVAECLNNMHIRQTVHPEDLDVVREQISKRISGKVNSANYIFRGIKKNGEIIHVEIFGSAIQLSGKPAVSGSVLDITERKRMEEELREFATIDELTKVWNRRFFLEQADRQVKAQARSRRPLAVLMLDIDLFKKVNDRFGHNIGDDALKTISQACLASLRETDLFGRLGGEEFAALLIDCDHAQAMQAAERMRKAVSIAEVLTPKENLRLTISVGVSSSNYTLDLEKLIKEADQAMYKAKETGRNRVCSFTQ
jgi:diguanylate cyclase (GGDEF)-like protein/PAS domain S-box-containing protein